MKMNLKAIGKYLVMILLVMIGIYAVKKVSTKYNVPIVSKIAKEV